VHLANIDIFTQRSQRIRKGRKVYNIGRQFFALFADPLRSLRELKLMIFRESLELLHFRHYLCKCYDKTKRLKL